MSELKVKSLEEKKLLPDQLVWETQGELVEETIQEKYPNLVKRYNELLKQNENLEMDLRKNTLLSEKATVNLATLTLKYDTDVEHYQYHMALSKSEINRKIQELRQELSNIEKEHSYEISSNIDQLKSSNEKISGLEESLQKSNQQNIDLIKNQYILTIEISDLKEKYNALCVDKSELEMSLKKSEEHLHKASSEVKNNKKNLETQMKIFKSKINEVSYLKCQVNSLKDTNTNLIKQNQDIGAKLHSSDILVKELSEKLENQKSEIEKEKFESEKQQLASKEKLKTELPIERDEMKKELKEVKSRNETKSLFKDEVDKLKTELYETGEQLYIFTQESIFRTSMIDMMNQQFGRQGEQLKHVEKELEETKNELKKSSGELLNLKFKLSENETELKQLNAENKKFSECKRQMEKNRCELDAVYKIVKEKDSFIISLQSDNEAMKKRLVELIKDKDLLWRRADKLMFEQKQQASKVLMDSSAVTNCLVCKSEFSLFHRKHYCRLCGKIFCFNCSNNWMMTPSSRKRERVCNKCFERHESPSSDDNPGTDNLQTQE